MTKTRMRTLTALAALTLPLLMASAPAAPKAAAPPSGPTKLVSRLTDKCADVEAWSKDDGAVVHQWSCRFDNDANQKWTFEYRGGGNWKLKNLNSGKCLDVFDGSKAEGARLQQFRCGETNSQLWEYVATQTVPEFFKLKNRYSGKCVDVSGRSHDDGAIIHQWTCLDGDDHNQQWRFPTST
ncbi:RICIN domain-containing protein [Streptomyces sp. NPDC059917]|uniref:RICIN domain-containing protein n=1 Tax=Streptomyces sp. NPDC059917 TaxID=3347002 RepID=UPI00364805C8